MKLKTSAY